VGDARRGDRAQAGQQLVERIDDLRRRQACGRQLRSRHLPAADVLEIEHVVGERDRVRHGDAGVPELRHHVVFGPGPAILQQLLAVGRHPLDGTAVTRLAELAPLPILHVVAERRRALHTERLELALLGDVAGKVALAGDQARATVVADAFDEVDLCLLAALDDTVIGVGVRLGDEPVGVFGHGEETSGDVRRTGPGRHAHEVLGSLSRRGRDRMGRTQMQSCGQPPLRSTNGRHATPLRAVDPGGFGSRPRTLTRSHRGRAGWRGYRRSAGPVARRPRGSCPRRAARSVRDASR
jgi:hypothetical protein